MNHDGKLSAHLGRGRQIGDRITHLPQTLRRRPPDFDLLSHDSPTEPMHR